MLKFTKNKAEKIATIHGTLTIKEDGTVEGLTPEQEKSFANVPGFEFTEDKKPAPKKEDTKEEPKEEEKKASTRKSTSTTRKTTTRKTTAKKDEDK